MLEWYVFMLILEHMYECGPFQCTVSLLHHANKGLHMNILEHFYIQLDNHQNKIKQKQHPGDRNPLFDLVYDLQLEPARHEIISRYYKLACTYSAAVSG